MNGLTITATTPILGISTGMSLMTVLEGNLYKEQKKRPDSERFKGYRVNGRDLGVLWQAPFTVDVTDVVSPGANALVVKVTNLWVNRLIGDEQLAPNVEWSGRRGPIKNWPEWLTSGGTPPDDGHVTFTTWRFYGADSPLIESGLIGPVVLRSTIAVTVL